MKRSGKLLGHSLAFNPGLTARALGAVVRSAFFIYVGSIAPSVVLAIVRLGESTAMPGLGAIELVLLALPWSLSLGVAPISRLGLFGMSTVILVALALNLFLLRCLVRLLDARMRQTIR